LGLVEGTSLISSVVSLTLVEKQGIEEISKRFLYELQLGAGGRLLQWNSWMPFGDLLWKVLPG